MPTDIYSVPAGRTASVSGADITASYLLANPRVIERRLAEAINVDYWIGRMLPTIGGDNSSGVVLFEEYTPEIARMAREAESLAADGEVPLASISVGDLRAAYSDEVGLGYAVTYRQERQNRRHIMDRRETALANEIAFAFNQRGLSVVTAAITAKNRRARTTDWSSIVTDGSTPSPNADWPHSQIALVKANQRLDRAPFIYDIMLAHPLDIWRLHAIYRTGTLAELAGRLGLSEVIEDTTTDVPRGQPILGASGQAGGTAWPQAIHTDVIDERRRRRKVVQTVGEAVYFVDNAYALLQLTGAANRDLGI